MNILTAPDGSLTVSNDGNLRPYTVSAGAALRWLRQHANGTPELGPETPTLEPLQRDGEAIDVLLTEMRALVEQRRAIFEDVCATDRNSRLDALGLATEELRSRISDWIDALEIAKNSYQRGTP